MTFKEFFVIIEEDALGAGSPITAKGSLLQKPAPVDGFKGDSMGGPEEVLIKQNDFEYNICPECGNTVKPKMPMKFWPKGVKPTHNLCYTCKQLQHNVQ